MDLCEGENDKLFPYRWDDFYTEFKSAIERPKPNPELCPYICHHGL